MSAAADAGAVRELCSGGVSPAGGLSGRAIASPLACAVADGAADTDTSCCEPSLSLYPACSKTEPVSKCMKWLCQMDVILCKLCRTRSRTPLLHAPVVERDAAAHALLPSEFCCLISSTFPASHLVAPVCVNIDCKCWSYMGMSRLKT